jgi:hypothetical protein
MTKVVKKPSLIRKGGHEYIKRVRKPYIGLIERYEESPVQKTLDKKPKSNNMDEGSLDVMKLL